MVPRWPAGTNRVDGSYASAARSTPSRQTFQSVVGQFETGQRLTRVVRCSVMVLRSAKVVADAILAKAAKRGQLMSNLKLQKLLYYVQGYHLAKVGLPAFTDQVKAWAHGPVVPVVYHHFKKYSWHEIDEVPEMPEIPNSLSKIIDFVLRRYLGFSAIELEDLTHAERPWQEARKGCSIGEAVSPTISTPSIRAFFSEAA